MSSLASRAPKVRSYRTYDYKIDGNPELQYYPDENGVVKSISPDMAVPDMAMTVPEILQRYTLGRPLPHNSSLHYTGDNLMPDTRAMDLVEQADAIEANNARIAALEASIKAKHDEKVKTLSAKQKAIDDALNAFNNQIGKNSNTKNDGGTTEAIVIE